MNNDDSPNQKYIFAIACFVIYVVVIVVLAMNVEAEETTWGRYTYLFQGVEAIVLAAVGWIFGKEVHRQQAKNAETRADAAQKEAAAKESELAKVKTNLSNLRSYIKSHAPMDNGMPETVTGMTESDKSNATNTVEQSAMGKWSELIQFSDSLDF